MLINEIRDRIRESVLHNTKDKDVLRVVLGEAQTISSRIKGKITDEIVEKIIRQMVANNNETIKAYRKPLIGHEAGDTFGSLKLLAENEILVKYLPVFLSQEEIMSKLLANAGVADDIFNAKNDGSATGIAMKEMTEKGLKVSGTDVVAVVKKIRNPGS